MGDYIIITGDLLLLTPLNFSPPPPPPPPPAPPIPPPSLGTVLLPPFPIVGSGPDNVLKVKLCVHGDEDKIPVIQAPVPYNSITYPVPGTGTLKIILNKEQIAETTRCGGTAVILKGMTFKVELSVVTPAMLPPPPLPPVLPDTVTKYTGQGSFQTKNLTVRGT